MRKKREKGNKMINRGTSEGNERKGKQKTSAIKRKRMKNYLKSEKK